MKTLLKILCTALAGALWTLETPAAVPLKWTVETSRASPVTFDAYRGETLALTADFSSYGAPLALAGAAALYVQTNGMESAWWTIPATVVSNRIEATLAPTNYPGAATALTCYLGGPALNYRAAFRVRLLGAPGATPGEVTPPVRTLDFSTLEVLNAPWNDYAKKSDLNDYVKTTGGTIGRVTISGAHLYAGESLNDAWDLGAAYFTSYDANGYRRFFFPTENGGTFALTSDLPDLTAYATTNETRTLSAAVATINSFLAGEDARFTITNYYAQADLPHLYVEQKVPGGGETNWLKVWDETTRWDAFLSGAWVAATNALGALEREKADRAWGFYDSHTGEFAPDNFTQISSSNILVAAGMGYQRTITAGGLSWWVLTANEPYTLTGTSAAGFFRIEDAEGHVQFEIVKGDKRVLPAQAGGVSVEGNVLVADYPIATPPASVRVCTDLAAGDWESLTIPGVDTPVAGTLATVTVTGTAGAYVVRVSPARASGSLFVQALYEVGGETYINNHAPLAPSGGIYHNGRIYRPVVNGNKLEFIAQ